MALEIDFNLCQDACDELVFTETTGAYDAVSNPTGYGAPNAETTDMAAPTLTLEDSSGNVTTLNIGVNFPSSDTSYSYTISLGSELTDGIYTATYTVVDNSEDVTYTKTVYLFFTCQVDCCIDRLYARVTDDSCADCNKSALQLATEADAFLCSAKAAARCGNRTRATKLLKKVQYLCNFNNCNCS